MTVVASRFERKENELYETESWATRALIRNYPVAGMKIWEPAAGNHKMVDALREAGANVIATDIATYRKVHFTERDFFDRNPYAYECDGIITNPPYGKGNREAVKFAEIALHRCSGMVALLLTAKFDFGKTRMHLFRDNPRFAAKIALVDRIQWFSSDMNGTEDHAWYVWGPVGKNIVPRLLYEGKTP
jgi:23S rRNA G2445 N2-methylase RlmL